MKNKCQATRKLTSFSFKPALPMAPLNFPPCPGSRTITFPCNKAAFTGSDFVPEYQTVSNGGGAQLKPIIKITIANKIMDILFFFTVVPVFSWGTYVPFMNDV